MLFPSGSSESRPVSGVKDDKCPGALPTQVKITSPFTIGRMVTDAKQFYGRAVELEFILGRLRKRESTSIVGARRIGKSSIAYHILTTCSEQFNDEYEFVWLDGQSNHLASISHMCSLISASSSIPYTSGTTSRDCLLNLEEAAKASDRHLVLIVNEFEVLTDSPHRLEFGVAFFNTLRYLAEQGFCSLITTSYTPLQDVCKHVLEVSSPFYNIFEELDLQHFTSTEANAFLINNPMGVRFSEKEIAFIRAIPFYEHPLVLQIAADGVLSNRDAQRPTALLRKEVDRRVRHFLTHAEVREGRRMAEQKKLGTGESNLSKPLDLTMSILIPVVGIGLFMLEFGLLMRYLSNFQAVLLGVATAIVGFAVLIFAGRSINIIGETTFFRLFSRVIDQIPLLSNLLSTAAKIGEMTKGAQPSAQGTSTSTQQTDHLEQSEKD
jgi:hypothetical protein